MGIFRKLFGRKDDDKKVGGMEDYMTLVRVYLFRLHLLLS